MIGEILPIFTSFLLVGMMAADLFPGAPGSLFLLASMVCLASAFLFVIPNRIGWVPLLSGVFFCGMFIHAVREVPQFPRSVMETFHETSGVLTGTFTGEFRYRKRGGVAFQMEEVEYSFASQTVLLPWTVRCEVEDPALLPEPGQTYIATGSMKVFRNRKSPSFKCPKAEISPRSFIGNRMIASVQRAVRDGMGSFLSDRHQALMLGFLLGDTSKLGLDDRFLFRETGITHLLAVSGQHVLVLAVFLLAVLTWMGVPSMSRAILTIGFLTFFAFLTAGQPSVWRALIMYIAGVAILHLEVDPGPVRPMAATALIILLFRPAFLHHIGFQMSFAAILGIVFGRPPIERFFCSLRVPLVLSRYLAVSVGANLGTIPLAAYHFGYVPVVSFLVNPLVVWTFEIILPMGLLLAVIGSLWFSGGVLIGACLSLILDAFLKVVGLCSSIPGSVWDTGQIPAFAAAAAYGLMFFLVTRRKDGTGAEKAVSGLVSGAEPHDGANVPEKPGWRSPGGHEPHDGANVSEKPGWRSPGGHHRRGSSAPVDEGSKGGRPGKTASGGAGTPGEIGRFSVQGNGEVSATNIPSTGTFIVDPFGDQERISLLERHLAVIPARSLVSRGNREAVVFPLQKLTLEGQNLFHRVDDLSREVLKSKPERLVQAQVFCLAMLAAEILGKVPGRLEPPPEPGEITSPFKVRNRHLALALAGDAFFRSSLVKRARDPKLAALLTDCSLSHSKGRELIARFMGAEPAKMLEEHFANRRKVLELCRGLVWVSASPAGEGE